MADLAKAPAQTGKKVTVYIATAPFVNEFGAYNVGDEVAFPGWTRDLVYDAARMEAPTGGEKPNGLTFWKEGPVIDKVTGERNLYRVTYPVKEQ